MTRTKTKLRSIFLVFFCGFLGALGQLFLKLASSRINNLLTLIFNGYLVTGILLYIIATILFLIALKQGEVSLLYPLLATSYIWVSIFSSFFLGEQVTKYIWIGNFFIIFGVAIIGYSIKNQTKIKKVKKTKKVNKK